MDVGKKKRTDGREPGDLFQWRRGVSDTLEPRESGELCMHELSSDSTDDRPWFLSASGYSGDVLLFT